MWEPDVHRERRERRRGPERIALAGDDVASVSARAVRLGINRRGTAIVPRDELADAPEMLARRLRAVAAEAGGVSRCPR